MTDSNHYKGTGKLMTIDFNDSIFKYWHVWINDTALQSGWNIQYLIRDDSSKYKDLYIQWSKESYKGLVKIRSVLELNGISIPTFKGENSKSIFMTHACSSTCCALLVLQKDSVQGYKDYFEVVNYNIKYGQILYVTDKTFNDSIFEVSLVDLNKNREHLIDFPYRCPGVFKSSYVDTVIFGVNKSIIKVRFDNAHGENTIKEQREIEL